ncbi:MAG: hypothetical protein DLM59_10090 [Pseudonocardiales bacterium]|nr:MAG: hypothetical protein DLM59_10090 [Pseudonocardiales bacterium]
MIEDPYAFRSVGGHVVLDFVATVGKRGSSDIERLRRPDDLMRWIRFVGLGDHLSDTDENLLLEAHRLREALYGLLLVAVGLAPVKEGDLVTVNAWARRDTPGARLTYSDDGFARDMAPVTAETMLAVVARKGIELLAGPEAALVRECAGPTCTLLFVDRSRGRRRRWCSMGSCGAHAKMRTLRAKQAGEQVGSPYGGSA